MRVRALRCCSLARASLSCAVLRRAAADARAVLRATAAPEEAKAEAVEATTGKIPAPLRRYRTQSPLRFAAACAKTSCARAPRRIGSRASALPLAPPDLRSQPRHRPDTRCVALKRCCAPSLAHGRTLVFHFSDALPYYPTRSRG